MSFMNGTSSNITYQLVSFLLIEIQAEITVLKFIKLLDVIRWKVKSAHPMHLHANTIALKQCNCSIKGANQNI